MKKIPAAFILFLLTVLCSGQTNFSKGEELFMQNKPADAVIFLESSISDDPSNVNAYLYLGIVYEQLDKMDEAIAIYRQILPMAGNLSATVACNLGNIYFRKDNTEMAEQYYSQAITRDSFYSRAFLGRANTRLKAGNPRDAVSDYERYLTLEPRSVQRTRIEQVISLIRGEFAAEERRRILAAEEERVRVEERQRLLDEVSASLQSAADSSLGISSGAETVEGYQIEFELD
jgi:tetratricopeptide (TPR) repeat protein